MLPISLLDVVDRLNRTARVKRVRDRFVLMNAKGIAIEAKTTGTKVRMTDPRISCSDISGFLMWGE